MLEDNLSLDTSNKTSSDNPEKRPIDPPPKQSQTEKKIAKYPPVPYLASLVAFVGLLVSTFYSLIGLVGFALDRLIVATKDTSSAPLGSFTLPDFSSHVVISQVAALLVCLPATIVMAKIIGKYESSQPWRLGQKMRRGIYIVGATLLIGALVSTIIGTAFGLLNTNLELKELSSSGTILSNQAAGSTSDKSSENIKTILQGIFNAAILCAGLLVLSSNYAGRRKKATWIVLGSLSVLALILIPYSTHQVYEKVQDKKSQNQEMQKQREERKNRYNMSTDRLDSPFNIDDYNL
ncbi:hypothetical protein GX865_03385 [Candidatus Saccharibacteria bacterium]|jgi:hypothetical protein|nr:hypothetical protein [Candidatus Saccharibacteria bacterium]